jgi:DNA repair protein RecO
MAGETARAEAICLAIHPWSRTSHVVRWLTPEGLVTTLVKGAVRPKSAFLGQYDLNYTCDIIFYARAKGDLHALRECTPVDSRDALRGDYRALVLADYFRRQVADTAPNGPEASDWHELLSSALDRLPERRNRLVDLLEFELGALELAGLSPALEAERGAVTLRGERQLPVSKATAACLRAPSETHDPQILLDASRAIGVFYSFHMDGEPETRRTVLKLISTNEKGTDK